MSDEEEEGGGRRRKDKDEEMRLSNRMWGVIRLDQSREQTCSSSAFACRVNWLSGVLACAEF